MLVKLQKKRETVHGIKVMSVLSGIIDFFDGVPVDYIHCVMEGEGQWLKKMGILINIMDIFITLVQLLKKKDKALVKQCPPQKLSFA